MKYEYKYKQIKNYSGYAKQYNNDRFSFHIIMTADIVLAKLI